MSQHIPLAAISAQTLSVVLDGQNCQISLRTIGASLYFYLTVDNVPILKTCVCRNRTRMLLAAGYFKFRGDFVFVDTQPSTGGEQQPDYTGLDSRYVLLYLTQAEVDAAG